MKRARFHLNNNRILLAAASYLSVSDYKGTIFRFVDSGEMIWAYQIAKTTKTMNSYFEFKFGKYAIEKQQINSVFSSLSKSTQKKLVPLIEFQNSESRQKFFKNQKMRSPEDYFLQSSHLKGINKVYALLLSGRIEEAVEIGIKEIRSFLTSQLYDFKELETMSSFIDSVRISKITPLFEEMICISFLCCNLPCFLERILSNTKSFNC